MGWKCRILQVLKLPRRCSEQPMRRYWKDDNPVWSVLNWNWNHRDVSTHLSQKGTASSRSFPTPDMVFFWTTASGRLIWPCFRAESSYHTFSHYKCNANYGRYSPVPFPFHPRLVRYSVVSNGMLTNDTRDQSLLVRVDQEMNSVINQIKNTFLLDCYSYRKRTTLYF